MQATLAAKDLLELLLNHGASADDTGAAQSAGLCIVLHTAGFMLISNAVVLKTLHSELQGLLAAQQAAAEQSSSCSSKSSSCCSKSSSCDQRQRVDGHCQCWRHTHGSRHRSYMAVPTEAGARPGPSVLVVQAVESLEEQQLLALLDCIASLAGAIHACMQHSTEPEPAAAGRLSPAGRAHNLQDLKHLSRSLVDTVNWQRAGLRELNDVKWADSGSRHTQCAVQDGNSSVVAACPALELAVGQLVPALEQLAVAMMTHFPSIYTCNNPQVRAQAGAGTRWWSCQGFVFPLAHQLCKSMLV